MIFRFSVFSKLMLYRGIASSTNLAVQNKAYVGGSWEGAQNGKTFKVYNPATKQVIAEVPDMEVSDVEKAISSASESFKTWSGTTAKERSQLLRCWFTKINEDSKNLATLVHLESGKPFNEAMTEVNYGNSFIEWFSEEARRIHGEVLCSPYKNKELFHIKQPIGVAALITPWNFPLAMITRKAGAALAAGCTCVIKPAEDTPLTALALAECAEKAGIPKGVINVVTCDRKNVPSVGKLLCQSPYIAGVTFTGSTVVGKELYKHCASGIKRISLELGGNAPFIVFDTADIKKAVEGAASSKFRNCGQDCKLQLGPLINEAQLKKVSSIVNDAIEKGAKVICGGKIAKDYGDTFYEPTVLTNIKPNMLCYNEEVFGPVVTCISFKDEQEALTIANSVNSGLAGYFYSNDISQIFRVAKNLQVGMVGVNDGLISTAEAAFGGIKESGIGREGSHYGLDEFLNIKYISLGNL